MPQSTYRVLTGPTASGKTQRLLARARDVPVRVISADSRQIFRGMDIGTGKPTAAELAIAPHYCLDLLDPGQPFSAFDFVLEAVKALRELEAQDFYGEVWVCGGTGLYIRALLERLPFGPPPRPHLRRAVLGLTRSLGAAATAGRLQLRLRESANPVRVVRAAESAATTPLAEALYGAAGLSEEDRTADDQAQQVESAQREQSYAEAQKTLAGWQCAAVEVLDPGPSLEERIAARVRGMFDAGLIDEVAALRKRGFGEAEHVARGIAYAEAAAVLDGKLSLEGGIARAVVRTRQYAKRQRTYFRGQGWN